MVFFIPNIIGTAGTFIIKTMVVESRKMSRGKLSPSRGQRKQDERHFEVDELVGRIMPMLGLELSHFLKCFCCVRFVYYEGLRVQ